MTPQEQLDYLLETVVKVDTTLYTARKVGSILGAVDYEIAMTTLEGMAQQLKLVRDALKWLNSDLGLDFSDPQTQSLIDQAALAGNWSELSPGLELKIKSIGIVQRPRWQDLGLTEPTIESVTKEITKQAMRQSAASNFNNSAKALSDDYNDFIDALDAWDGQGDPPVLGGE